MQPDTLDYDTLTELSDRELDALLDSCSDEELEQIIALAKRIEEEEDA